MSLISRQTRLPQPFDPERATHVLEQMSDLPPPLHALLLGVAGCSPYLATLMTREADWLPQACAAPEAALEDELARLAALPEDQVGAGLRQGKRRIALLAGVADLAGAWSLEEVTGALTRLADASVSRAMQAALAGQLRRGKLPGMTEDDLANGCGMVALAMGKMGAFELNYSSDIDLICLFDETRYDEDTYLEARAGLIRATRAMVALLADVTSEGYVFRTDLRLRPDPSVTPVCVPMAGAESYYESLGRTWERAAFIKARPAAGDIAAGEAFLKTLRPFVWRKHLDFAAIQDAHDMRLKIRDHKGLGGALVLEGHNMKLGRGGIREIEFFAQTQQLVLGGRNEALRLRGTIPTLEALVAAGHLRAEDCATLSAHYRFHRMIEHRVQMVHDAQTHTLPTNDEGFARLAAMQDCAPDALRAELTERLEEVHALTESYFAPSPADDVPVPDYAAEITARWPDYPALRSDRAGQIFARLRPQLLQRLDEAAEPEQALRQFDRFLAGLPAGVQLFSLFEANPKLVDLMGEICARAPGLAQYLGDHVGVFDAVIGGTFFEPWPGLAPIRAQLEDALSGAPDYEAQLMALRRVVNEQRFRIGVHLLRGLTDPAEAGRAYAELAEATLSVLWPHVVADFATRHGAAPGQAIIVAMGSLGAGKIHTLSDLDLLLLYEPGARDSSDGPRPLEVRPYFARLTQALITALKAPMAGGILYDADMRLRPSGRKGPVATSFAGFQTYQDEEAWTWEHLAQTRARAVAGDADLAARFEAFRAKLIGAKGGARDVRGDLADMRARIQEAKQPASPWEAKIGAGRLQDIELAAQALGLQAGAPARDVPGQIAAGLAAGLIEAPQAERLVGAAALFWQLQAVERLLVAGVFDPDKAGKGAEARLLRALGAKTRAEALELIDQSAADAAQIIEGLL